MGERWRAIWRGWPPWLALVGWPRVGDRGPGESWGSEGGVFASRHHVAVDVDRQVTVYSCHHTATEQHDKQDLRDEAAGQRR